MRDAIDYKNTTSVFIHTRTVHAHRNVCIAHTFGGFMMYFLILYLRMKLYLVAKPIVSFSFAIAKLFKGFILVSLY